MTAKRARVAELIRAGKGPEDALLTVQGEFADPEPPPEPPAPEAAVEPPPVEPVPPATPPADTRVEVQRFEVAGHPGGWVIALVELYADAAAQPGSPDAEAESAVKAVAAPVLEQFHASRTHADLLRLRGRRQAHLGHLA